jgi:hypothetical protein
MWLVFQICSILIKNVWQRNLLCYAIGISDMLDTDLYNIWRRHLLCYVFRISGILNSDPHNICQQCFYFAMRLVFHICSILIHATLYNENYFVLRLVFQICSILIHATFDNENYFVMRLVFQISSILNVQRLTTKFTSLCGWCSNMFVTVPFNIWQRNFYLAKKFSITPNIDPKTLHWDIKNPDKFDFVL